MHSSLITLHNGRPGIRTTLQTEIREVGRVSPLAAPKSDVGGCAPPSDSTIQQFNDSTPADSCLDFISSDESLDRYDETITPAGWQLDSYQKNPVFQNSHQYGDILFTLGKALITEVRDGRLYQRIQFATDINPMARIAHGLYAGGFLSAVSVGFVPVRWENGTEKTAYRRKYIEQELLEVSAVAIPANPNALALGLKSGAVEKSDLRDLADLIRCTLDHSPGKDRVRSVPNQNSAICNLQSQLATLRTLLKHI